MMLCQPLGRPLGNPSLHRFPQVYTWVLHDVTLLLEGVLQEATNRKKIGYGFCTHLVILFKRTFKWLLVRIG